MINCVDAEKCQSEISETLQQAEKLGLISKGADEYGVPAVVDQGHALKQGSELISQLTFGFEPIHSGAHNLNLCTVASGLADDCEDHLGERVLPHR
jgi:hypothetical protein